MGKKWVIYGCWRALQAGLRAAHLWDLSSVPKSGTFGSSSDSPSPKLQPDSALEQPAVPS